MQKNNGSVILLTLPRRLFCFCYCLNAWKLKLTTGRTPRVNEHWRIRVVGNKPSAPSTWVTFFLERETELFIHSILDTSAVASRKHKYWKIVLSMQSSFQNTGQLFLNVSAVLVTVVLYSTQCSLHFTYSVYLLLLRSVQQFAKC